VANCLFSVTGNMGLNTRSRHSGLDPESRGFNDFLDAGTSPA